MITNYSFRFRAYRPLWVRAIVLMSYLLSCNRVAATTYLRPENHAYDTASVRRGESGSRRASGWVKDVTTGRAHQHNSAMLTHYLIGRGYFPSEVPPFFPLRITLQIWISYPLRWVRSAHSSAVVPITRYRGMQQTVPDVPAPGRIQSALN